MNSFQTIVLGIFGFFVIAGLIVISLTKERRGADEVTVTLWGSAESRPVKELADSLFPKKLKLVYRRVPEDALDDELVEALSQGAGPDVVLLPAELLLRHRDKLILIPYTTVSEREYKDTFMQGADVFLLPKGIAALPFTTDPLVMYWNRDLLDEAGIPEPPKLWSDFLLLANQVTLRDEEGNITRSSAALGEYRNVAHAKEILQTLLSQAGNPVVSFDASGIPRVTLQKFGSTAVIDFYTEFGNPEKAVYSWNRSLPNSREAFTRGDLAAYFGFGSEREELAKANPNLNFDVAPVPRPKGSSLSHAYGKLAGLAVLKTSRKASSALQAARLLTTANAALAFSRETGLPPPQRKLLVKKPTDAFGSALYDAALRSRPFLDPNPEASSAIFQTMIESVTSGKARSNEALGTAQGKLSALLR